MFAHTQKRINKIAPSYDIRGCFFGKFIKLYKKGCSRCKNRKKAWKYSDIEIDEETGKIVSVTIPSHSFLSTFTKKRDTIISWENIVKIGDDIILVKQEELQCFVY